jgi:hypothetical protein
MGVQLLLDMLVLAPTAIFAVVVVVDMRERLGRWGVGHERRIRRDLDRALERGRERLPSLRKIGLRLRLLLRRRRLPRLIRRRLRYDNVRDRRRLLLLLPLRNERFRCLFCG